MSEPHRNRRAKTNGQGRSKELHHLHPVPRADASLDAQSTEYSENLEELGMPAEHPRRPASVPAPHKLGRSARLRDAAHLKIDKPAAGNRDLSDGLQFDKSATAFDGISLLSQVTAELRADLPLDLAINRSLQVIAGHLDHAIVAVFRPSDGTKLLLTYSNSIEERSAIESLSAELEQCIESLKAGEPAGIVRTSPLNKLKERDLPEDDQTIVALPMICAGELVGVFSCELPRRRVLAECEFQALEAAAGCIALAIAGSRGASGRETVEGETRLRDDIIRGFYDSTPLMMGVVELVGDDILHITDNLATGKFFNKTALELRGELSSSLGFPKQYRDLWISRYRESEWTKAPVRFEYVHSTETCERLFSTTVCFLSLTAEGRPRFSYIVEDITDRKQAIEALRESERLVQRIAETAPNIIYIYDIEEGCNVYTNRSLAAAMGYEPAEVDEIGPSLRSTIMHSDDAAAITSHYDRLRSAKEGEVYWIEYRLRRADGEWRWFQSWEAVFKRDDQGSVRQVIGSALDITERIRAEEALREMEAFTRQITEATPDLFCIIDLILERPLYLTGQLVAALGYSVEDTLRRRHKDLAGLIHTDDYPALREHLDGLLEAKDAEIREIEIRIKRSDGEWRWIRWRNGVFGRESDGTPIQILCLGQDVTEQKRAEERLREQAALLNHAQDAIMVRDMQGKVLYWNQGAERLYGFSEVEAVSRPVQELIPNGHSPRFEDAIQSLAERGEWQGQLKQTTGSGDKIVVESRWTLVRDESGKPKTILVINTDITEKKRLEAQFLRAQRMESIGTLAGGIAHDLNNVLSPILMSIQMLQSRFIDDESQRLLLILRKSTERGADMVSQVLSFARGIDGERVNLNPRHLVKEIVKMLRNTLPKDIDISFSASEDLWPVAGDATQLYQVLMNLCVNSRDAMPDGGRLMITAENVRLDREQSGLPAEAKQTRYVKIKVADTGAGIPPENLDKIFDPFFTTKKLGEGTGLGLSTVAGIVRAHGGFMTVSSEVAKGSQFDIYFPAAAALRAKGEHEEGANIPVAHGEVVLVVDDEVAIQEITRETLEACGYKVMVASDGAEAVGMYAQNKDRIKVVLLDMMMPYMDGPATIRTLRQLDPKVRIMVVSGLAGDNKAAELAALGIRTTLSKPYTASRLLSALAAEMAN